MEFLIARVGVSVPKINLQWRKFTHQLARQDLFLLSFFHLVNSLKKELLVLCAEKFGQCLWRRGLYTGQYWWRREGYTFMNQQKIFLPMFYPTDGDPNCFHLLLEQCLNHQYCYQHLEKFTFSFVDLLLGAEHFCSFK